jgi:hypothetical protein
MMVIIVLKSSTGPTNLSCTYFSIAHLAQPVANLKYLFAFVCNLRNDFVSDLLLRSRLGA